MNQQPVQANRPPSEQGPPGESAEGWTQEKARQKTACVIEKFSPGSTVLGATTVNEDGQTVTVPKTNQLYQRVLTVARSSLRGFFAYARRSWALDDEERTAKIQFLENLHGPRTDGYVCLPQFGETMFHVALRQAVDLSLVAAHIEHGTRPQTLMEAALAYYSLRHIQADGTLDAYLQERHDRKPLRADQPIALVSLFSLASFGDREESSRRRFAQLLIMSMFDLSVLLNEAPGGHAYLQVRILPLHLVGSSAWLLHSQPRDQHSCVVLRVMTDSFSPHRQSLADCRVSLRSLLGLGEEVRIPSHLDVTCVLAHLTPPLRLEVDSESAVVQRTKLISLIADVHGAYCCVVAAGKTIFELIMWHLREEQELTPFLTLEASGAVRYKVPVLWASQRASQRASEQDRSHDALDVGVFALLGLRWTLILFVHDPAYLVHSSSDVQRQVVPLYEEEFFSSTKLSMAASSAAVEGAWPASSSRANDSAPFGTFSQEVSQHCEKLANASRELIKASRRIETITTLLDPESLIWQEEVIVRNGDHTKGKRFEVEITRFVDAQEDGQAIKVSMRLNFDLDKKPSDNALFAFGTAPQAVPPCTTSDPIIALWVMEEKIPELVVTFSLLDFTLLSNAFESATRDEDGTWTSSLGPIFDVLVRDGFFTRNDVDATFDAAQEQVSQPPVPSTPPIPLPRHRVIYVRRSDDSRMECYEEAVADDDAAMGEDTDEGPLRSCPRIDLDANVPPTPVVPAWPISGVSALARKLDVITLVVAAKLSYIDDDLINAMWCAAERSLRYFPSRHEVEYIVDRLFTRVCKQGDHIPPERLRRSVFELLLDDTERASEEGLYLDDRRGPREDEMDDYSKVLETNLSWPVPPGRSKFRDGEKVRVVVRTVFSTLPDSSGSFVNERYTLRHRR